MSRLLGIRAVRACHHDEVFDSLHHDAPAGRFHPPPRAPARCDPHAYRSRAR
jgi:hypothetical protein